MTQIVPKKERYGALVKMMQSRQSEIANALPKHCSPEKQLRLFATAVQRNPVLLQCDDLSLWNALITSSQLGLDLTGVGGQAYVIPYKNGKTGNYEAQFQVGYRGLVELARRSGEISTIYSVCVFDGDQFSMTLGDDPKIVHEPNYKDKGYGDAEHVVGAYAVAKLKDGSIQREYMTRTQLDAIRARSKASNNGPWVTDRCEMYRKTVTKRLCKMLPQSTEMATAMDLSDRSDAGKPQWTDDALDASFEDTTNEPDSTVVDPEQPQPSALIDQVDALIGQMDIDASADLCAKYAKAHKIDGDNIQAWTEAQLTGLLVELRKAVK